MRVMDGMKVCSKCRRKLLIKEFFKNRSRSDGLDFYCKICRLKQKLAWQKANPEKYKEGYSRRNKKYKKAFTQEAKESRRRSGREYHKKHKSTILKKRKERREVTLQNLKNMFGNHCQTSNCKSGLPLEFHHSNSAVKRFKLTYSIPKNPQLIPKWQYEISRCVLVCEECHRAIHEREAIKKGQDPYYPQFKKRKYLQKRKEINVK